MLDFVLALIVIAAGLTVGSELAVALFIHPRLSRLEDRAHAAAAQALARGFGRVMPFCDAVVLLLTLLVFLCLYSWARPASWLALASVALWLVALVFTLIGPATLNGLVVRWDLDRLPADWKDTRRRGDRMHAFRVLLLLLAFALLTGACVMDRPPFPRVVY